MSFNSVFCSVSCFLFVILKQDQHIFIADGLDQPTGNCSGGWYCTGSSHQSKLLTLSTPQTSVCAHAQLVTVLVVCVGHAGTARLAQVTLNHVWEVTTVVSMGYLILKESAHQVGYTDMNPTFLT